MKDRAEEGGARSPRAMLDDAVAPIAAAGGASPRLDAEILLANAAGVSRATLIADAGIIDDAVRARFAELVKRRAAREPLAYIIGRKEFYAIEFAVAPAVLIPRPESEIVVDAALEFLAARPAARVIDIGTGSGAIAIAIAVNTAHAQIVATDISIEALEVAERNAARLGMRSRVEFRRADCFDIMDGGARLGRFDLVVSNPPYVADDEIARLQPEISRYEPRCALAGGCDGMDFYRRIAAGLEAHLAQGGAVIVEVGDGQSESVSMRFRAIGLGQVTTRNDLAGAPRAVCAMR